MDYRPLGLAALVAVALVPTNGGAGGVTCGDPCTILANGIGGYVPPAEVITSGTKVTWDALDTTHPTGDITDGDVCFIVTTTASTNSPPVRFDISGGGLWATTSPGTVNETTAECTSATPVDGGYVVKYECKIHPQMKAALVIVE